MPEYIIHTLGCKLNQLESEAISSLFSELNYRIFNPHEYSGLDAEAPLVIINTCTVTSKADQKARRLIRKVLRDHPASRIIVTGCYAQLNKDDLQKLETDNKQRLFVVKKEEIISFLQNLFKIDNKKSDSLCVLSASTFRRNDTSLRDKNTINQFEFNPARFSEHTRSLLKIQDGCSKKCTYCKIRLARGLSISLDKKEVLSRLRLLEKNHAEAVLTGVSISQYRDNNTNADLTGLLEYLLNGTEKVTLRLSSLTPDYIDENFTKVLSGKRIRPHFHLSVQSGSKKILDKMGRTYDVHTIENAVILLRCAKDDPFLACDIITGFPGETEIEFMETYNMCKKLDFAWIHVFPYSKRDGTEAYLFKDNVKESEVSKRVRLFTELADKSRENYVQRWLDREVDVLIEKSKNDKTCHGVSENYLKVLIKFSGNMPPSGTVLRCKLIESSLNAEYDVIGEPLDDK
ncbi:MAG: tRNA (N(6)-L-threonylcarbamoyladenosine(37)-C(2))-methylthiotransferase MtaB [Treponema sp.]|nr:tRNA (N(6)-L-threonylcarbamoyladenosine(37)-C(2))-methylthiotransferase MtaB [Treponema sp.]